MRKTPFSRCTLVFFFSSRRRHTRCLSDWSSDVCSSDLGNTPGGFRKAVKPPEVSVPPKKQRFPAGEVDSKDCDERNSLPNSKAAWRGVRSGEMRDARD